jgi:hypothetical protein
MPKTIEKHIESDDEQDEVVESDSESEVEEEQQQLEEVEEIKIKGKKVKKELTQESYLEEIRILELILASLESKKINNVIKGLKKYNKKIKKGKKSPDGIDKIKNAPTKPVPEKFKEFFIRYIQDDESFKTHSEYVDFNINNDISRSQILKIICYYIKKNNLYNKKEDGTFDKNIMLPDDSVKTLLKMEEGEVFKFTTYQKMISRLYVE